MKIYNIQSTPNQIVNSGESATMNCTVEGYPVESVEWLHDGVPVLTAQDNRIRLLTPLVLIVGSIGRRDKGMYQCLVRSDKENAQATAELKLGGNKAAIIPILFRAKSIMVHKLLGIRLSKSLLYPQR